MHRLKIHGFLGIKDADITLDGLTVLIGPQASGKSVVARLIYFFNEYLANFDITAISNNEHKKAYDKRKRGEFYEIFPPYSWQEGGFTITYFNDSHWIIVLSLENSAAIEIKTSSSVAGHFRYLKGAFKKFIDSNEAENSLPRIRAGFAFREFLATSASAQYESALFVPAARSFYATIRDEIFSILALDEKIDHIILQFGEFYETAKTRALRIGQYKRYANYFKRIVKGTFERANGQDWLVMDHGRIEMSRASSGQQEAVPLLFAILDFPRKGRTLIIEEPEAHLFPEAQVEVLRFMIRQLGMRGGNIMFTTHSPYLLSALNNHILEHEKGKRGGIPLSQVRAYSIYEGISESLIDEEMGLVSAEYIDSVSEKIAERFVALTEGR